jgi:hypothetical protein
MPSRPGEANRSAERNIGFFFLTTRGKYEPQAHANAALLEAVGIFSEVREYFESCYLGFEKMAANTASA